jgi:presenilin-like A22 family membrane protease
MHFFIDKKDDFLLTLNESQKMKYKDIIQERFKIYIFGMILGLVLGFLYVYIYNEDRFKVCKFVAIVLVTKLTFYYFYPKSDFMLYHLTEKNQVSAWTDVYRNYKNAWRNSLILATISYILLSFSF